MANDKTISKIKTMSQALYWALRYKTKEIMGFIIIIMLGLFIFFNVSYSSKEGLVIKPSVKVEVKK